MAGIPATGTGPLRLHPPEVPVLPWGAGRGLVEAPDRPGVPVLPPASAAREPVPAGAAVSGAAEAPSAGATAAVSPEGAGPSAALAEAASPAAVGAAALAAAINRNEE